MKIVRSKFPCAVTIYMTMAQYKALRLTAFNIGSDMSKLLRMYIDEIIKEGARQDLESEKV